MLYAPLDVLLCGETNKNMQMGSAHCMLRLFTRFKEEGDNSKEVLERICVQFVNSFIVLTRSFP